MLLIIFAVAFLMTYSFFFFRNFLSRYLLAWDLGFRALDGFGPPVGCVTWQKLEHHNMFTCYPKIILISTSSVS